MKKLFNILSFLILFGCGQSNQIRECSYDFSESINLDTISLSIPADTFAQTIIDIETRIVDLTAIGDVFLSDKFVFIYDHAPKYLNNVVHYLSDTTLPSQCRIIALLTMTKQDFDNNLNFLFACEKLYKRSLIDESFLLHVLFPLALKNRDIIKFYDNEKVKLVLTNIRDNPKTTKHFKLMIDEILSGKRYRNEKMFLKDAEGVDI